MFSKGFYQKISTLISILILSLTSHLFSNTDYTSNRNLSIDELIKLSEKYPEKDYLDQVLYNLETLKNYWIQDILMKSLADSNKNKLQQIVETYEKIDANYSKWKKLSGLSQFDEDSLHYYEAELEIFKRNIFQNHPNYAFFLKAMRPVKIAEIQQDYIQDRQVILHYWVSSEHLYVMIISKDDVKISKTEISYAALLNKIADLLIPLYGNKDVFRLNFNLELAHELYRLLFQPIEKYLDDINELVIIPDDILLGLPFECLVVELSHPRYRKREHVLYDEFRNVTFLINKYAIAYNFSIISLNSEFQSIRSKKKLGRKLLTMSELTGLLDLSDTTGIGWNLQTSPYGREEVQHVSRLLWRHENIKNNMATKDFFKENGYNYRWIYLPIPGMLNNQNSESSALIFSKSTHNSNDYKLSISDILNGCKLRADLLTLSSCEVKPVDSVKRYGVIGLPQAFLLSGAQSVLYSLWRVNDITVSRFMNKFYWELKYKRQTNTFALQYAKLTSLKDTFDLEGKEISRAHPYFWSPYILIGDVNIRPPTFSTIPPRMVILIIYIIVLLVSLLIVRKTLVQNTNN